MAERHAFRECIALGVVIATGFTALAAVIAVVFFVIAIAGSQRLPPETSWLRMFGAAATVISGYYLAGVVGGAVYYPLQRIQSRLGGQMLLAFVFGFIGYGAIGLTAATAFSCCGINIIDYESPADAWHQLPMSALALAAITAIIGPLVWRLRGFR